MNLNEKAEKTVRKLLKLTRENKIDWARSTETRHVTAGTDERVQAYYTASYEGVRFRVYETNFQICPDGDSVFWTNQARVEIVDFEGALIWRLPQQVEMWDLLATVQVKAGEVEDKLDQFLSED